MRSTFWSRLAGGGRHRAALGAVLAPVVVAALLAGAGAPLRAQEALRLWAAQTGPDQVALAWSAVPGAAEYRIHIGDPDAAGSPAARRPIAVLSGSARGGSLPLRRVTAGLWLVAVAADGRPMGKAAFNEITPVRGVRPAGPPASATATVTGAEEVTLSWDPVPGATAYVIGRAVAPGGLQLLCGLCSTETTYVDRDVTPGAAHSYTVAAIYPGGVSARTPSNRVTPGEVVAAEESPRPRTPLPTLPTTTGQTPPANTAPGQPTSTPPTYTPPGQPAGAPSTYTPPGQPAGTASTSTPPVQPAGNDSTQAPPRVNPQIPATVPDTTPPPIGAPPSGASSLVTPPADTGTCKVVTAPAPSPADTLERIDTRADRIDRRTTTNPDAVTTGTITPVATTTNLGSPDYQKGKCLNPYAPGYPDLWDPIAAASGMTSAEVVAAWKEIGIIALEYKHILGRQPTPAETKRDVAALKAGTTWPQLWRQLAHSVERDTRFGYWAPAPIPDSLEAQKDFGTAVPPWTAQQCYGGLGPKCAGGIPDMLNGSIAPHWFGAFRMPDYTELAYIEMGVAVGSILHDNACLKYKDGLNCNGLGAGDFVKNIPVSTPGGSTPVTVLYSAASLEWNKAAWNVLDQRTWRATFGPYPTNLAWRDRYWYDDLRPAVPRSAMMAPAVSMFTWPGLTVTYTGGETLQSRALLAPAGTSLDATDVAFCRSGVFRSTGSFPGKAPWGICADGVAVTTPHAATPVTGTPATGTPTSGTSASPASCKLDYMRADNMLAAFGRPDGFLGVESITLTAGENKVFITDWKYQKQRNDGVTYYGSHLRVATNSSSRPIRLQTVSVAGALTSTVRLDPNTTKKFQADLRAVYCEP